MSSMEANLTNLGATIKTFETQIGPLALDIKDQSSRLFSSVTEKNSRGCKVVTLRSGKELPSPKVSEEDKAGTEEVLEKNQKEVEKLVLGRMVFSNNPPLLTPPLPFPQRFQKKKLDEQFIKFFNIFKMLEVNIPFVEALTQMPIYVKFMKEIMSNKRKLEDYGTVVREVL